MVFPLSIQQCLDQIAVVPPASVPQIPDVPHILEKMHGFECPTPNAAVAASRVAGIPPSLPPSIKPEPAKNPPRFPSAWSPHPEVRHFSATRKTDAPRGSRRTPPLACGILRRGKTGLVGVRGMDGNQSKKARLSFMPSPGVTTPRNNTPKSTRDRRVSRVTCCSVEGEMW